MCRTNVVAGSGISHHVPEREEITKNRVGGRLVERYRVCFGSSVVVWEYSSTIVAASWYWHSKAKSTTKLSIDFSLAFGSNLFNYI